MHSPSRSRASTACSCTRRAWPTGTARPRSSTSHVQASGTDSHSLAGGVSLPTLYFHDDESPLLAAPSAGDTPRARWGFPPFLSLLAHRAVLVRSSLVHSRQGAELWLVNPSRADREVHEAGVDSDQPEPDIIPKNKTSPATATDYPPSPGYPAAHPYFDRIDAANPRQALLTSLSTLTNLSRRKASQILSHPLAQPVVPHLPPAVRSLVNVPGEWECKSATPGSVGRKGNNDVASEFESARLYLAKWARIVAEEGERARRSELAAQARIRRAKSTSTSTTPKEDEEEDLASSLGVFSLLPSKAYTKQPIPSPTRTPQNPITLAEWDAWATQGQDELFVRQQIFKRGFSDAEGDKLARREGWEVLLGVVPWSVGLGFASGDVQQDMEKRRKEREEVRQGRRQVYEALKIKWRVEFCEGGRDAWKEEWHRIDVRPLSLVSFHFLMAKGNGWGIQVDCRRTDRNQPIYAVPTSTASKHQESVNKVSERKSEKSEWEDDEEEGGMASLNRESPPLQTSLATDDGFKQHISRHYVPFS